MATQRNPQRERLVACPQCSRLFSLETLLYRGLDRLPAHADQRDLLTPCSGGDTPLKGLPILRSTNGTKAS